MPRIRHEDVQLVRERAPIAEVVGEHVTLRNAGGGSLKGLCPFHDEKSPSFHVTPAKGLYFCFGCQAGGDVIDFVRRIDHLEFNEAVEKLASRAGVTLRYEEGGVSPRRQVGERTRLVQLHRDAEQFYIGLLTSPDAEPARAFLRERGFDAAAADRFGVGFSPDGWDGLVRHLRGKGYSDRDLVTGGLAKEGPRGLIDRFRGRLMWPLRDITGDTVGFGARKLLDGDSGPKYLNSPETPIYRKSQVLFGIDRAKRDIASQRRAVIVEGYTDVMACHLAGVTTAVATCGTAFGDDHRKVLRRLLMDDDAFGGQVIFTFDGDAAGRKAALRAFADDQRFVAQTFVAVESHGLDPCELRQQYGDAAVVALVESRVPMFEFAIKSELVNHDLTLAEGRVAALRAAAPLVASIRDQSLRPEYGRALAGWLGMEVPAVQRAVVDASRATRSASKPAPSPATDQAEAPVSAFSRPDPHDRSQLVDRELLKLVIQEPQAVPTEFDDLTAQSLGHPGYVAVANAVRGAGGVRSDESRGKAWIEHISLHATDDAVRSLVMELAVEPLRTDDDSRARYAREQLARVQGRQVDAVVVDLRSRLQRLDPESAEYTTVFGELVALEQQRRQLRDVAMGERA